MEKTNLYQPKVLLLLLLLLSLLAGMMFSGIPASAAANHFSGSYVYANGVYSDNPTLYVGRSFYAAAWHGDGGKVTWYAYKDGSLIDSGTSYAASVHTDNIYVYSPCKVKFKFYCHKSGSTYYMGPFTVEGIPQSKVSLDDAKFSSKTLETGKSYTASIKSTNSGSAMYWVKYEIEYYDGRWKELTSGRKQNGGTDTTLKTSSFKVPKDATRMKVTWTIESNDNIDIDDGKEYEYANVDKESSKKLKYIDITPSSTKMTSKNKRWGDLKVKAYYTDGSSKTITNSVRFSSNNDDVAYVRGDTLYSGDETGIATITASYSADGESDSDTIRIAVEDDADDTKLSYIRVTPSSMTINETNSSGGDLAVKAYYSDGSSRTVTSSASFKSSNSSIAYVSGDTVRSGSSSGTATITATYSQDGRTVTDTCRVTVNESNKLSSIAVSPDSVAIQSQNTEWGKLAVIAYYSDGTSKVVTSSANFNSNNGSIAYVSNSTLFSGSNSGSATITASYSEGGITRTDTCSVTVNQAVVLSSISITPSQVTIPSTRMTWGGITVTANYSDGTSKAVTESTSFSTSNRDIAYVSNSTLRSDDVPGLAIITATYSEDGRTSTATCSVTVIESDSMLTGISVTPHNVHIDSLNSYWGNLAVIASYSNGTSKTVTNSASFSSTNGSIAYVNNSKLYSGSNAGSATITATYTEDGVTRTAVCTVTVLQQGTLTSINLSPSSANIYSTNRTWGSVTVTAHYADGSTRTVTNSVSFSSSNSSVAYVSGTSLRSGSHTGSATITASYTDNGVTRTDTCYVTVGSSYDDDLSHIVVSPSSVTIHSTNSSWGNISVTAYYEDGTSRSVTSSASFSSSNSCVAYISGSTLRSGNCTGNATITVSYRDGGVTRTTSCYVNVGNSSGEMLSYINLTPSSANIPSTNSSYGSMTVTAHYTNGNSRVITNSASYSSSNSNVAYVSYSTLYSGSHTGSATITASYTEDGITRTDTCHVTVGGDVIYPGGPGNDGTINPSVKSLRVEIRNAENRTKYALDEEILYYIDYYNGTRTELDDVEVVLDIPDDFTATNYNQGALYNDSVEWVLGSLHPLQSGRLLVKLKCNNLSSSERIVDLKVSIKEDERIKDSSSLQNLIFRSGERLYHEKYISGYGDHTFRPERGVTRAEFAAMVARMFNLSYSSYSSYSPYKDINKKNCWAYEDIKACSDAGLFGGYPDGTFKPDKVVTRAEFAAVLARKINLDDVQPVWIHSDDIRNHWALNSMEQLNRLKILLGYSDGSFKPNRQITRAEAVTLLNRFTFRGPLVDTGSTFRDVNSKHWAFEEIEEAARNHRYTRNSSGDETIY